MVEVREDENDLIYVRYEDERKAVGIFLKPVVV